MRRPSISPEALERRGWKRSDPRPWTTKLCARYEHVDGWRISHSGHPTALHPWLLEDPRGRVVLTGVLGPYRRPDYGTAWDTLDQPTARPTRSPTRT